MDGSLHLGIRLPDLAKRETRVATVIDDPVLPAGRYAFNEFYCAKETCDCRRVLILVTHDRPDDGEVLATLNYGWETAEYYQQWMKDPELAEMMDGLTVEPLGHQSRLTPALKALFEYVLTDPAYVERLKRHYAAFKADIKRRPLRGATRGTLGATPGRERITRAQAKNLAFQFRVTLRDITPPIWRLIEVPATYTFWDLHTAIQDAMGWTDSHLHAFEFASAIDDTPLRVGSPNDDGFLDDEPTVAGWDLPLTDYFALPGAVIRYEYDFGDDWQHDVLLEAVVPQRAVRKRPRCLAGERACPPEDCGGSYGYQELVAAMAKPHSAAHREYLEWLGQPYDAEHFDPSSVRFHDPKQRRRRAYGF